MGVSTEKYIRKPLYVDAVRVTPDNFNEISAWCQGEIDADAVPGSNTTKKFIKVRVHNPKNPRQTKAFVGDWLLYTERGYKVYTNKAFRTAFDQVTPEAAPLSHPETPNPPRGVGPDIVGREALAGLSTPVIEQHSPPVDPQEASIEETVNARGQVSTPATGVEEPPAPEPITEQAPEVAAAGKRVLSQAEQRQMGADEVRDAVSSGEAILAQDLS